MIRTLVRAAAIAVLIPTVGCLRYEEELVVLPDGSGKMVLSMGFNLEILEKFKEMGMDPAEQEEEMGIDIEDLENFEGVVAMTRPKGEKKGTWKTWTFIAYFEDINKVRLIEKKADDTKTTKVSFAFRKEGDGYALEIDDKFSQNEGLKQIEDLPEEGEEAAWEMLKGFLKGFEMQRAVRMPGPVTSNEGFSKKDGRVASNRVDESAFKGMGDLKKAMKTEKRKLVCGPSAMSEADVAAFKKELEEAKAEWPKIKEELKAEAKKKKVKKDE